MVRIHHGKDRVLHMPVLGAAGDVKKIEFYRLSIRRGSRDHPWTVASLAAEAGMSRSAFALRFKQLMSESPLEYLTRWRMYRGSDLLRESDRKLADVAQAVGYDSDGAFHKAFKRVLGIAPGEYRRSVGATQPL